MQRRIQGRAGGPQGTGSAHNRAHCPHSACRTPSGPPMALLAADWGPDPRGAGPPRVAAARQVFRHRQRAAVTFGGRRRRWRGPGARRRCPPHCTGQGQLRCRSARGQGSGLLRGGPVQGVAPLLQVSIWGHQWHGARGETRAQQPPLEARLRGRAELPVTALRHQAIRGPALCQGFRVQQGQFRAPRLSRVAFQSLPQALQQQDHSMVAG